MTLYMARIELDLEQLFANAPRLGLPPRADLGYLVHAHFSALFGADAPKPFSIESTRGRRVGVLGYTRAVSKAMADHAKAFADPAVFTACVWDELASKPMPERIPAGTRLGFRTLVVPTIRKSQAGSRHRAGAEVDAFLARCWEVGDGVPVDREQVYRMWFGARIDGAATLESFQLVSFTRESVLRREAGRERARHFVERPSAAVDGVLRVADDVRFSELLARGIGRHRAFGFGMLKLRPPT